MELAENFTLLFEGLLYPQPYADTGNEAGKTRQPGLLCRVSQNLLQGKSRTCQDLYRGAIKQQCRQGNAEHADYQLSYCKY